MLSHYVSQPPTSTSFSKLLVLLVFRIKLRVCEVYVVKQSIIFIWSVLLYLRVMQRMLPVRSSVDCCAK